MYVKVIKNFVTTKDLEQLNKWTLDNFTSNPQWFMDARMDNYKEKTRFTTRLHNDFNHKESNYYINYPQTSYEIQNRIVNFFRLENIKKPPSFVDGIVNGIGFDGGSICNHIDPTYFPNTYTMHCNIISQKADSGGVTIIENVEYDIDEGDLLCYVVSEHYHEVTPTVGKKNRILWVFGFCIDDEKLNQIFY